MVKGEGKNIVFMTFTTYYRVFAALLVTFGIGAYIGIKDFGVFAYWLAIATLATIPVGYGFGLQTLKEIAGNVGRAKIVISQYLVTRVFISVVVTILMLIVSVFLTIPLILWLLFIALVFDSLADQLRLGLRGVRNYKLDSKLALVNTSVYVILVLWASSTFKEVELICIAILLSRFIALGLMVLVCWNMFELRNWANVGPRKVVLVMKNGFNYGAETAITTSLGHIDTVILGAIHGPQAVGIYNLMMKVFQALISFASVLGSVFLPRLSSIEDNEERKILFKKLQVYMVLVGAGGAICLLLFVDYIALWLGDDYLLMTEYAYWVSICLFVKYLAGSYGLLLTSIGCQKEKMYIVAVAFFIFLLVAFILVPEHEVIGMFLAVLSNIITTLVLYRLVLRKKAASFQ